MELDLFPVFIGADAGDSIPVYASEYMNLAGKTDLAELGWLFRHAAVVVTNDSGPSHLAAAVGCPLVTLFGRTAPMYGPTRWRPLSERAVVIAPSVSRKLFEGRDAHWRRSFAAITVDEVVAAVRKAMS
jgi:ADP-heptose:LPS heptosyltransferase